MQLPPDQVERFYSIWKPLLLFVNRRLRLVPEMLADDFAGPWDVALVKTIRDALWADDALRTDFLRENPAGLSPQDLALVDSWQYRRAGEFYVLRHLKKHSIFLEAKGSTVYGVLGLASPLQEILPFEPCYVLAVLLPFEGRIIYDSLIMPYNITFGRGIRSELEHLYKDAKERGAIVTSLEPRKEPAAPEELRTEAHAVNVKVLDAFRAFLYASGLTTKVVERDLALVTDFAENYLGAQPEPLSLRDFGRKELEGYLSHASASGEARRRQAATGLKRFVRFLLDTERMDYDSAEYALELFKRSK